jgi:hypothetical protein
LNLSKSDTDSKYIIAKEAIEKIVAENELELLKCISKKGYAYLFDTMDAHRRNLIPQSKRAMLHLNFTNGHSLHKF